MDAPTATQAPGVDDGAPRTWRQRVLFWAPVWLPATVLTQLALLGLCPALVERNRLARSEDELALRLARESEEAARIQRWLQAQEDPIYLERERRLLRAPPGDLLLSASAREP